MANVIEIQDDLTILSRRALEKVVAREGHEMTKAEMNELTPDELKAKIRELRVAKGIAPLTPPVEGPMTLNSSGDEGSVNWKLSLPAMPIRQLGRDAFVTAIKYRDLDKLDVDPEVQREAAKRRIPAIANYVLANDGYFGAVVVTAIGPAMFDEGRLIIDQDVRLVVNDGQHRILGIRKAIADDAEAMVERMDDDLPVLVYADLGKTEMRQLFADINLHAMKPNRAVALNYNNRDFLVKFTKELVTNCAAFRGKTSFLKTKIGAKDSEVFTFSAVVDAVGAMFDDLSPETYSARLAEATAFWNDADAAMGETWDSKATIAHVKNSLVAIGRLYGFNVDWDALAGLDWSVDGELDQIARSAGGTNAAVKALYDELAKRVVKEA